MSSTGMNIHLKLTAKDADGKVIGTTEKDNDIANDNLANSLIVGVLAGVAATYVGTDSLGAPAAITLPFVSYEVDAGSGLVAVARTDFVLTIPIAPPSGAGTSIDLNDGAPASGGSFYISGHFLNASGGPLVYGEIAINATDSGPLVFMLTHDLTNGATGFTVPNNGTLDFAYTVTYS